jgi:hypothetical protein
MEQSAHFALEVVFMGVPSNIDMQLFANSG